MAQVNAGRVRFVGRGEYNNSTQYYIFDLVNYDGNSYFAKSNTLGNLPTNTTYWQLIAEKGNTGSVGPTGETGNGIASITKTSTSGLVDTYTITFTNGQTTTYQITNGANGSVVDVQVDGTSVVDNGIANIVGISEIKQELEDMYNLLPKVSGTGETITLDGTVAGKMLVDLKGNTSQETTTGKNLFKASNGTFTRNGVTATINNSVITLNGTATANVYLVITSTEDRYSHTFSGDYTISKITSATTIGSALYGTDSGGTDRAFLTINNNASTKTQAINETYTSIRVQLNIDNGATFNNTIVKLQLEQGSSATSWEPYTNGASPNPDYPQDIHVVSGDNSIDVCGKNLFNVENGTRTFGGQTYSIEDNIFKFSSTTVSGGISAGVITPYTSYSFDTSSSYVWSLNKKSGNWTKGSTYPRVLIYIKYSDNTTSYSQINLNTDNQESASNTITFTSGKIPVSFAFGIYAPNGSLSNNVSAEYYVQLEKSNQVTTYEEYKGASYPINLGDIELCKIVDYQDSIKKSTGKNLFNVATSTTKKYAHKNTGNIGTSDDWSVSDFIPVSANTTYRLSGITNSWSGSAGHCFYKSDKTFISSVASNVYTFTTPSNAKYVRISLNSETPTNVMFNKGTVALPYEPYGKVWCLNKQIGKVILNGSESWIFRTDWIIANGSVFRNNDYVVDTFNTGTLGYSNYLEETESLKYNSSYKAA